MSDFTLVLKVLSIYLISIAIIGLIAGLITMHWKR